MILQNFNPKQHHFYFTTSHDVNAKIQVCREIVIADQMRNKTRPDLKPLYPESVYDCLSRESFLRMAWMEEGKIYIIITGKINKLKSWKHIYILYTQIKLPVKKFGDELTKRPSYCAYANFVIHDAVDIYLNYSV